VRQGRGTPPSCWRGSVQAATLAAPRRPSATSVLSVMTSHRAYPILRYFHFRHAYDALPRLLLVTLDLATLIESALDTDRYRALVDSAAVAELRDGGLHVLDELATTFLPAGQPRHPSLPEQAWRERYDHAVTRLRAAGIATTPDHEAGAPLYRAAPGVGPSYRGASGVLGL